MRKLLLSLANYRNISIGEEEVDLALKQTQGDYSGIEWNELLSTQGYSSEDFRNVLKESLLVDLVLEREVLSKITLTENELENYYEDHMVDFSTDHGVIPYKEVKELIKQNLLKLKGQQEISLFMEDLYARAMFVDSTPTQ